MRNLFPEASGQKGRFKNREGGIMFNKKSSIHRFRTIVEQNNWELKHRLESGKRIDEIDRYEYMRLKVKAYPLGIYRFKTLKEKQEDEFKRVMSAWEKLVRDEK